MVLNVMSVNYRSEDFVINLINKLNGEDIPYEFILVDNSGELDKKLLNRSITKRENSSIKIIKNNLKISNSCLSHVSGLNLGLCNLNFDNPYTLICDPDVSFSCGILKELIDYMNRNDLDILGVRKYKRKYPYIWFTLVKTKYLQDFYFLYLPIKDNIIVKGVRKLCRMCGILPNIEDSGDSIYELIKSKNLKYESVPPVDKNKLPNRYKFLSKIKSTEYIWKDYIISHFNCGSETRYKRLHGVDDKEIFFKL